MSEESIARIRKKLEKILAFKIGSPEEVQLAGMILQSAHALSHPEKLEASLDKSIARWESERRTNGNDGI